MSKDISLSSGRVLVGDCVARMRDLPDNSVDAVVTDPPYGINFMGKAWDGAAIEEAAARDAEKRRSLGPQSASRPGRKEARSKSAYGNAAGEAGAYDFSLKGNAAFQAWFTEVAAEAYRVLKPGGHLLSFGGTRTYHRMACAIEDAGFEIRDSIHWLYGSGFPKSLDVSKAIDKRRDDTDAIHAVVRWLEAGRQASGVTRAQVEEHFGTQNIGQALFTITPGSSSRVATWEQWLELKALLSLGDEMDGEVWRLNGRKGQPGENWDKREVTGQHDAAAPAQVWKANYDLPADTTPKERRDIPATDDAKQWSGWGTALKPAHEPIVVARKPLAGTVAGNVLAHGTGALNIDGCRVGTDGARNNGRKASADYDTTQQKYGDFGSTERVDYGTGRWPANVIFDTAAGHVLDQQSGVSSSNVRPLNGNSHVRADSYTPDRGAGGERGHDDSGGASRFFTCADYDEADVVPFVYQAKPSKAERNAGLDGLPERERKTLNDYAKPSEGRTAPKNGSSASNHHPTVKPVALMRHLVRLVTPPGGTVLDPFLGSGTTAVAASLEGFQWIGCEMTDEYLPIIKGRIAWAEGEVAAGRADKPQYKKPAAKPKPQQPTLTEDGQQQ